MGRERGRREREEEERRHRERVETFLAAATSSVAAEETQQEGKMELLEKEARNSPIRRAAVVEGRRGRTPQPIMWQVARKHVVSATYIMYMYIQFNASRWIVM